MYKGAFKYLLLIFSILVFSCKPTYYFQLDILKPAQIKIPDNIQKVIIINHAQLNTGKENDPATLKDDALAKAFTVGVSESLTGSPRYKVSHVSTIKKNREERFSPLESNIAHNLCQQHNANGLIVMENYAFADSSGCKIYYVPVYGSYLARLKYISSVHWKLYDSNYKVIDDIIVRDTSVWEAYGRFEFEAYDGLPDMEEAKQSAAYRAGQRYSSRISQVWEPVNRFLYQSPNSKFSKAFDLTLQYKWLDAIEIWKPMSAAKNKDLAAKASFNIAVCCEALDNLDAALEWAAKSFLIKPSKETDNYISILEKRVKLKLKIMEQL
jgi:hypothetical protein